MTVLLTLAVLAWFAGGDRAEKAAVAQQLLRETLAARDSLPLARYIQNLEQVTRWDGRSAEGYYQLGLAWAKKGSLEGRAHALEALQRAVTLAPRNTAYHYALAQLHVQRDFLGSARSELKKIMALAPSDARPYYHLALFAEDEMLRNRDKVSFHENATISFYSFALADYIEAERLLRTAVALDPLLLGAYYHLAGLLFEAERFQEMAELLQDALTMNADREAVSADTVFLPQPALGDLYLLQGLAFTKLAQLEKAERAYDQAFARMTPDEHELFYSLATVLSPDSLRVYMALPAAARAQMTTRFWRKRDPLFLTSVNERLVEHFSRIAYANLRFSLPLKSIAGWKTDRGQTLIRFGFPRGRLRTRADLGATPSGHVTFFAAKEMWDYGDFYMLYEDRAMSQNYSFAWSFDPALDGKNLFETKIEKEPERYEFSHGGLRLNLPRVIAQFRAPTTEGAGDSTVLEIYYGLNTAELHAQTRADTVQFFSLQRGMFLCDANWQPVVQRREQRRLRYTSAVEQDSYVIERWTLPAAAGDFNLSLEVQDQATGFTGVAREPLTVERFSSAHLQMSSVLLAKEVTEAQPDLVLYQKGGVSVIPSLSREFEVGSPLYVYYEIYNLEKPENGETRFRVENTVVPLPASSSTLAQAVKMLGRWLGAGDKPVLISSAFETRGTTAEEKLYHAIELTGAQPADYRLTVTVTDLHTGEQAARSLNFTLRLPAARNRLLPAR